MEKDSLARATNVTGFNPLAIVSFCSSLIACGDLGVMRFAQQGSDFWNWVIDNVSLPLLVVCVPVAYISGFVAWKQTGKTNQRGASLALAGMILISLPALALVFFGIVFLVWTHD